MKCNHIITSWILFLSLSSSIAIAQIDGAWDSVKNSCNCNIRITIGVWEDGSPSGTIYFPGSQSNINNIFIDRGHISFPAERVSFETALRGRRAICHGMSRDFDNVPMRQH